MKRFLILVLTSVSLGAYAQKNPDYYNKQDYEYRNVPTRSMKSPFERYTHYQVTARYGIAMPNGSLKDYVNANSKYNYSVSGEFVYPEKFSLGVQFNYQYFKDRTQRDMYTSGDQSISAVQTRSLGASSLHVYGKYHFAPANASLRPYALLGVGGSGMRNFSYYGYLEQDGGKNQIALSGQAGVGARFLFAKNGSFGADVQATYFYSPFKSGFVNNVSTASVSAGLFYRWW